MWIFLGSSRLVVLIDVGRVFFARINYFHSSAGLMVVCVELQDSDPITSDGDSRRYKSLPTCFETKNGTHISNIVWYHNLIKV